MLQILLFLSTRLSNLGDSMCRLTHGVFALVLFTRVHRFNFKFTPTLASPPSLLLDASAMPSKPSHPLFPRPSNEISVTRKWPGSFIAQGFKSYSSPLVVTGRSQADIIKVLILLSLVALLCLPFSSNLVNMFTVPLFWARSVTARLSAFVHAGCCADIRRKDDEVAEKCSALDIALQQIKQGNAQIQSLSAENSALADLAIEQGSDIWTQSALIVQLDSQLHEQRLSLGRHEWDARANSQEVARLEERLEILTVESDIAQSMLLLNLRSAHARERQLGDALHANKMLLSEAQSALLNAEEMSHARRQSLSLELEMCAEQREHWKALAEQAETRVVGADRSMLNLRKELAVAFKNAREAKVQLDSHTVTFGERDATIRSLNRELVDVRGQLQNAKDEVYGLRLDLECAGIWKPLNATEERVVDGLTPLFEWDEWLTMDNPTVSAAPTQQWSRSPDMSIGEFDSIGSRASTQASSASPNEILSCSTTPVVRSTTLDDLREQIAYEQLARARAEDQLNLRQMKVLATEAVVIFHRRQIQQLSTQKCQATETNASLSEELHNLKVERSTMLARIALLEADLTECQAAQLASAKAADQTRSELTQTKEILLSCTKEVDAMETERDALDMRLSQALLLSSALHERVVTLEQRAANVITIPSDGLFTSSVLCSTVLTFIDTSRH
ncbi:hypothetical protein B0F90DRAFT_888698 [Multifurca ochricompacta]|uniref:Uncharacterized protein n=1 Tax=Multifurca ochricompacta TaxID=376703 RepID=A0AAD4M0I3_9AGAM|nr:hypothetical protein B0F90DRAFT_888698 [Multifurca ochricompacta]